MESNASGDAAYPCIIDLRAFAAQVKERATPSDGRDYLADRHFVELPDGPTRLGTINLASCGGRVEAMPHDEFILVLEGALHIAGATTFDLSRGESAVLPKHCQFAWTAHGPTTLLFMSQESDTALGRDPVKIDPSKPREPSPPLPDGVVIGDMPNAFRHLDFLSDDKRFAAGSWNSNGYARHPFTYDFFELMLVNDGAVTLTDKAGVSHVFETGDVVVICKGGEVGWTSTVPVSKTAAVCRP